MSKRTVWQLIVALLLVVGGVVLAESGHHSEPPPGVSESAQPSQSNGPPPGKLTYDQVAQLAHEAGVPDDQLAISVAISAGESSHEPRAFNDDPATGDLSYGLWQVNMIDNADHLGPKRLAQYGLSSNEDIYDPQVSVRIMMKMSSGGTEWSNWGAFTNGSYLKHMSHAEDAAWNVLHPDQPPRNPGYWHPGH